jgi:hypothetical protein
MQRYRKQDCSLNSCSSIVGKGMDGGDGTKKNVQDSVTAWWWEVRRGKMT